MAGEIGEIRSRIDLVDLVESYGVALKRTGKTFKGLCPFHTDKNPSFTVNPMLGTYRCWACGEHGDVFAWVQKTQNVDFKEALKILADRAGVKLSSTRAEVPKETRQAREAVMDFACSFFKAELARNKVARDYCARRGISDETISNWELGFSPDSGEALATALKKAGYSLSEAKDLFLVDGDQNAGYYDKFRGRLMFPIRSERGELVAFGGRILGDGHPKYINSGDTPLYRKSRVLYGMYQATEALRTERKAFLVEGYLDVIACHQAGLKTAMASLGTALAEDQAKLLKRWTEEVAILYDADSAGVKAADRAADILADAGLKVRICVLPQGEDPDSLSKNGGLPELISVAKRAVTPLDFRLLQLEKTYGKEDEEFWTEAVRILAGARSEMEIMRHVDRLAPQYPGISNVVEAQKALRKEIENLRRTEKHEREQAAPTKVVIFRQPLLPAEVALFAAYLEGVGRHEIHDVLAEPGLWSTAEARAIAASLSEFKVPPEEPATAWIDDLSPEAKAALEAIDFAKVGKLTDKIIEDSIAYLRKRRDHLENQRLSAEESGDERLRGIQERLKKLKST